MARSKSEEHLESALGAAGLPYRSNQIVGAYEVDFIIDDRVVVEVDGYHHLSRAGKRRDARKDSYLRSRGYQVCRIPARRVWIEIDLDSLITDIRARLKERDKWSKNQASSITEEQKAILEHVKGEIERRSCARERRSSDKRRASDPHAQLRRHLDQHFPEKKR